MMGGGRRAGALSVHPVRTQEEASSGPHHGGTPTRTSSLCCLSHPLCGVLSQQPEMTETVASQGYASRVHDKYTKYTVCLQVMRAEEKSKAEKERRVCLCAHMRMYLCVSLCVHVCLPVCPYTRACLCACKHICVHVCTSVHVCLCVDVCVSVCACMYTCACVSGCACMHICDGYLCVCVRVCSLCMCVYIYAHL